MLDVITVVLFHGYYILLAAAVPVYPRETTVCVAIDRENGLPFYASTFLYVEIMSCVYVFTVTDFTLVLVLSIIIIFTLERFYAFILLYCTYIHIQLKES